MQYIVSDALKHLSCNQIDEMLEKYYKQNEKTSTLLEYYRIDLKPSQFSKNLPQKIYDDIVCPYCGEFGVQKMYSRSSYLFAEESIKCPNCSHDFSERKCDCKKCKQIEVDRKNSLILKTYNMDDRETVKYELLTLTEKIYLSALLRAAYDYDKEIFIPYDDVTGKLAPTEMIHEIFTELIKKKIISVHPNSQLDSFKDCDEFPNIFYTYKVKYYLNITNSTMDIMEDLMNPTLDSLDIQDAKEIVAIWNKIALNECLEYLRYKMSSVGLELNAGEKTYLTFNELLKNYSVSQIMNIIYRSISQATHQIMERKLSKKHGANLVIHNCLSYGEKAVANQWDVMGYRRDFNCKQSILSELFFNRICKIGEKCFTEVPEIDVISLV